MAGADDLDRNYYCVAEVLRTRRLAGQPIPAWLRDHERRLDNLIRMSQPGHEIGENRDGTPPLRQWITTAEAAAIIGCSTRHTRRLRADLGGQQTDEGKWLFPRDNVIRYANQRKAA
jgi:hypothetical protein